MGDTHMYSYIIKTQKYTLCYNTFKYKILGPASMEMTRV